MMLMPAAASAEDAAATFHELLIQYRCPVVDGLEQVYAKGDPASSRDRFLAITVPHATQAYVQCMFHDTNSKLYCEAASGYYYDGAGAPRTFHHPANVIAALGRLGFSTDNSAGNSSVDLDVADPPNLNTLADFMLRALHDAYGARAEMNLLFNAPLAPRTSSQCIPVSQRAAARPAGPRRGGDILEQRAVRQERRVSEGRPIIFGLRSVCDPQCQTAARDLPPAPLSRGGQSIAVLTARFLCARCKFEKD